MFSFSIERFFGIKSILTSHFDRASKVFNNLKKSASETQLYICGIFLPKTPLVV